PLTTPALVATVCVPSCLVPPLCRRPLSTLFPYTTLFRSLIEHIPSALAQLACGWAGQLTVPRVEIGQCATISGRIAPCKRLGRRDRKSTRLNSSHVSISYAVFCLKKKNRHKGTAAPSPRI